MKNMEFSEAIDDALAQAMKDDQKYHHHWRRCPTFAQEFTGSIWTATRQRRTD